MSKKHEVIKEKLEAGFQKITALQEETLGWYSPAKNQKIFF